MLQAASSKEVAPVGYTSVITSVCAILGSHSGSYEELYLVRYNAL
jgi:hypothetical protein